MPVRERTRKELEKHPLYRDAFTMQNILVPLTILEVMKEIDIFIKSRFQS